MTIALYDSALYGPLFADSDIAALFADAQRVQAMVTVESALAKVQGDLGIIPADAAAAILRMAESFSPELDGLRAGLERDGVPVSALVAQLRAALGGAAAHYIHWGATTQDILDTALVLQLKAALERLDAALVRVIRRLARLADAHRGTVMAGRTHSQQALPISFGLKAANWLAPLLRQRQRLGELWPRLTVVQFGGAAGTLAALGESGPGVMQALADELELACPALPWHTQRDSLAELAGWLSLTTGALGKFAQDVILLAQSEVGEVREGGGGGGSSTLPQKSNPIASEMIVACARMNAALLGNMHQALIAEHERATHGWQLEWLTLPQMLACAAAALKHARRVAEHLDIDAARMRSNLDAANGLLLAEAATFALAAHLPRPEAQQRVKAACGEAAASGRHLLDVLAEGDALPIDWAALKDPGRYLGASAAFIDRVLEAVNAAPGPPGR